MPVAFYAAWLQRSFMLPGTWTKSLRPQLLVTPSCPPEPCAKAVAPAKAGRQWSVVCCPLAAQATQSLPQAADRLSFRRSDRRRCPATPKPMARRSPATAGRRRVKANRVFVFHQKVSKTCDIGFVVRIPRRPIKRIMAASARCWLDQR